MIISINPFKNLPLYSDEEMNKYQQDDIKNLPPHLFSVTRDALDSLIQR
jgi:myosin-1